MGWQSKVEVRPSQVHGLGVYAAEFIRAGTKVWCFDDAMHVLGPGQLGGLSDFDLRTIFHGGYFHFPSQKYIYYEDAMKYVNHGDPPFANIGILEWTPLQLDHSAALRDIEPGEELLEDYEFFSIMNLREEHWIRRFHEDFCPDHYGFLRQLRASREVRRLRA